MLYSYKEEEIIQASTNSLLEWGMLGCLVVHIATFFLLAVRRVRDFRDTTEVMLRVAAARGYL